MIGGVGVELRVLDRHMYFPGVVVRKAGQAAVACETVEVVMSRGMVVGIVRVGDLMEGSVGLRR